MNTTTTSKTQHVLEQSGVTSGSLRELSESELQLVYGGSPQKTWSTAPVEVGVANAGSNQSPNGSW